MESRSGLKNGGKSGIIERIVMREKKKVTVSVVCPLFEAEKYIRKFDESLTKQTGVEIVERLYAVTKGKDKTEEILRELKRDFTEVKPGEFSHSLVREKLAMKAKGEVIVFLTQDVVIKDKEFLKKLVQPIVDGETEAAYARQRTKYNNIEKYTREFNYPPQSEVVSKNSLAEKGIKTFFFSDAAGAVKAVTFRKLKGYDGKDLPISEDMYFAYKLIMQGGKIKYVAEAEVYHSHNFGLGELYRRYKLTGKFMKMCPEIYEAGAVKAGGGMAKYILKRAAKEKNFKVLLRFLPDMIARYAGMKVGRWKS